MRNEQFPAGKVLEEYQNKIYHLALSISRNEKDAEDIVQNTFVKILRKLPTFSGRAKLSTWVYRVAYNESLMFLRKKRRIFNSSDAYLNYAKRLPAGLAVNWSKLQD
nr:sigma-70 family RNA polymerase sigma factor [Candidatus Omnitrophota bacterium]